MAKPPSAYSAGPELVIGLAGATGTDHALLNDSFERGLGTLKYQCEPVRLIELLEEFEEWNRLPEHPEEERIKCRMDAGDKFRELTGTADALAQLALGKIRDMRQQRTNDPQQIEPRRAYILRSLKRPEEVDFLRAIYGSNFFLIGAYSPRMRRVADLAARIAGSHYSANSEQWRSEAERLIQRDLEDHSKPLGQRVGETFPKADYFVSVDDPPKLQDAVDRFLAIIFGYPFNTPTKDEYGMFHAQAAALRSAALSRQVGAAITTPAGAVVAVGTNDVPKAGGGLYWPEDENDRRDHQLRKDASDEIRRNMLAEVLERLITAGWITDAYKQRPVPELVREALRQSTPPILKGTQVMRVIEYGRAVHAEMAAIVDAANRGTSVAGCTLYTTTYPCHNCARHIIAAGIDRVVYVEPYPKSLSAELHSDAMVNDASVRGLVNFQAFTGLAPSRYMQFFEMVKRKNDEGRIVDWVPETAVPRNVSAVPGHLARELNSFDVFLEDMRQVGIISQEAK